MTRPLKVGILGAGMIATTSWGVLPGMAPLAGRVVIHGITSRTPSSAGRVATQFGIPRVYDSLEHMLTDSEIDAVLNLTPIAAHDATSLAILRAGKHLVTEKPLSTSMECADELISQAEERGLVIVSSPPRMREPTWQLVKKLILDGEIGPVAFARVASSNAGPAWRAWPADPRWFYASDAGPLLDMGVYGIQAITGVLGPARRVHAVSGRTLPSRVVAGGPFAGEVIPVETDDNILVTLEFGDSTFAVLDSTFNVRASRSPEVEIYGLNGTIAVNAASQGRPRVEIYRVDPGGVEGEWIDATDAAFAERQARVDELKRAILLEDLADALESGRAPLLNAPHARHTLEIALAAVQSARERRTVDLTTTFDD